MYINIFLSVAMATDPARPEACQGSKLDSPNHFDHADWHGLEAGALHVTLQCCVLSALLKDLSSERSKERSRDRSQASGELPVIREDSQFDPGKVTFSSHTLLEVWVLCNSLLSGVHECSFPSRQETRWDLSQPFPTVAAFRPST